MDFVFRVQLNPSNGTVLLKQESQKQTPSESTDRFKRNVKQLFESFQDSNALLLSPFKEKV
jgi:hypothetical protein